MSKHNRFEEEKTDIEDSVDELAGDIKASKQDKDNNGTTNPEDEDKLEEESGEESDEESDEQLEDYSDNQDDQKFRERERKGNEDPDTPIAANKGELIDEEGPQMEMLGDNNPFIKKVNDFARKNKAVSYINRMGSTSMMGIRLLTSPITWVAIGLIFLFALLTSGGLVVGNNDYNLACDISGNGILNIDADADDFTRQSGIASWLTSNEFVGLGNKRMTKEQAAGVIGNLIRESAGARPNYIQTESIRNPDFYKTCGNECVLSWGVEVGKAAGIVQWDGGRRKQLVEFAMEQNKEWFDLNIQLQFLKKELDGNHGKVLARNGFTETTKTIHEYAHIWNEFFEASGDDEAAIKLRGDEGVKFASAYRGGGGMAMNCSGGSVDTSNIVQLAIDSSHPRVDKFKALVSCGRNTQNCGLSQSREAYVGAWQIASNNTIPQPSNFMASCDHFVATMVHATNMDPEFPWRNSTTQLNYMKNSDKYEEVSCPNRQPGDILGEPGHIMIYIGPVDGIDSTASASFMERTASRNKLTCDGNIWIGDYAPAKGYRKVK